MFAVPSLALKLNRRSSHLCFRTKSYHFSFFLNITFFLTRQSFKMCLVSNKRFFFYSDYLLLLYFYYRASFFCFLSIFMQNTTIHQICLKMLDSFKFQKITIVYSLNYWTFVLICMLDYKIIKFKFHFANVTFNPISQFFKLCIPQTLSFCFRSLCLNVT